MCPQKPFCGRNAVPMVEFIRMLRDQRDQEGRTKFPRRLNGRLASPPLVKRENGNCIPIILESAQMEKEVEDKDTLTVEPIEAVVVKKKRPRSTPFDEKYETRFVPSPFACEILTRSSKGMYSSTYVDIELSSLGLEPLVRDIAESRRKGKLLTGVRCCYLRLGTALVVSGCIVEVNVTDFTAQVVPDKGLRLDVEWVDIKKLYHIPDDLTEVRKTVSERVFAFLQREAENATPGNNNCEGSAQNEEEDFQASQTQFDYALNAGRRLSADACSE
ncbi:hypothetical protein DQ04_00821170 [Trypanosoma grayi]|uniref:hypothetical protein n=1 Tax=Trypanosoma grayi TaxID=71804 RepID=UPI0004F45A62|nr:hypothetical protein DQ04_00821170 [Trypanosoma grayi]KEG13739.1 hypothetical protein DQ04_00821170 [Trypanosoma grayi]